VSFGPKCHSATLSEFWSKCHSATLSEFWPKMSLSNAE
jgi:hypothetical protein